MIPNFREYNSSSVCPVGFILECIDRLRSARDEYRYDCTLMINCRDCPFDSTRGKPYE